MVVTVNSHDCTNSKGELPPAYTGWESRECTSSEVQLHEKQREEGAVFVEGSPCGNVNLYMRKQVPLTYPVIVIDSAEVHTPQINTVLNSSSGPDLPKSSSVWFILRHRLNSSSSLHLENYRSLIMLPHPPVFYLGNPFSALFITGNHIPV